jgi:hypothetical protein
MPGPEKFWECLPMSQTMTPNTLVFISSRRLKSSGGIPRMVTTDFGSETIDMAAYQMFLSHHYGGITVEEARTRMRFTKSTRNQKIEALWSQMMKHHNQAIINVIQTQIDNGRYNPDDEVEK